jgi:hypothetical protein
MCVADHVRLLRYCVRDWMSVLSASSIASSSSIPRQLTCILGVAKQKLDGTPIASTSVD